MTSEEKSIKLAKLDWYREVLNLEPNSKLFLQLARLLAELGIEDNNAQFMNEAFEVLRRGLSIHPDYMEARLYLIELLNLCGCRSQCGAEVARLASLFLSYPDFWDAWREYAITENESSDFTVALGFMSAIMRNKSLSIVQVLEAGLNALRSNEKPVFLGDGIHALDDLPATKHAEMENFAQVESVVQNVLHAPKEEIETQPVSTDSLEKESLLTEEKNEIIDDKPIISKLTYDEAEESDSLHDVLPKEHVENYINFSEQQKKKNVNAKQTLAELIKDANIIIEPRENSPFRTKSMADLLAEQGDYKGALDIYQELLSKGDGDTKELEERISDIKSLCPELNVKIDPSQLLAIDDYVDTSFGLMAKKEEPNTSQDLANNLDLPINDTYLEEQKDVENQESSVEPLADTISNDVEESMEVDTVSNELEMSKDNIESFMNEEDSPLVDVPFVASPKENVANEIVEDMPMEEEPENIITNTNEQEIEESFVEDNKSNANTDDLFTQEEHDTNVEEQINDDENIVTAQGIEDLETNDSVMISHQEDGDLIDIAEQVNTQSDIQPDLQAEELEELDTLLDMPMDQEEKDEIVEPIEMTNSEEETVLETNSVEHVEEMANQEKSSQNNENTNTVKFNADVADILSKLAERLEVRAN